MLEIIYARRIVVIIYNIHVYVCVCVYADPAARYIGGVLLLTQRRRNRYYNNSRHDVFIHLCAAHTHTHARTILFSDYRLAHGNNNILCT